MRHDTELFQTGNINDYSLLVGICELRPGEAEKIRKKAPSPTEYTIENFIKSHKTSGLEESATQIFDRPRPQKAFFEAQEGGMVSACGKYIYYVGIIDTLTGFGTKKVLENTFKSIVYDGKTISCVPPVQYGDRFYKFMMKEVFV